MGETVVSCISGDDGGGITIGIVRFWLLGNAIGFTDVVTVSSGVEGLGVVVVAIVVGLGVVVVVVVGLGVVVVVVVVDVVVGLGVVVVAVVVVVVVVVEVVVVFVVVVVAFVVVVVMRSPALTKSAYRLLCIVCNPAPIINHFS
jgi:hypothetical protein